MNSSPAVRATMDELIHAVRREHQRRGRRRKTLRSAGAGALVLTALSSAALAAGGTFQEVETVTPVGEVQRPANVTIQAVDSFPEFVGKASSSGFVTRAAGGRWGNYIYHVTGGEAPELGCGYNVIPTNNIYITSTRALSETEITSLLQPDGEPVPPKEQPRPAWITSMSDGCPNPGLAGQPGTQGVEPQPVKSSVTTPTSQTTHILIRKKTKVPLQSPTSGAPTPTTPTSTTHEAAPASKTTTTTSAAPPTNTQTESGH